MRPASVNLRFIVLLSGLMAAISGLVPSAYGKVSAPSPHDETLGSLIYAKELQQGCDVMRWSMATMQSRLLVSAPECPLAISLADHGRKAMLLNAADMQILDLASDGKPIASIPLPQPTLPKDAGPANAGNPVAKNAGYDAKGSLMVVMEYVAPASDTYDYLFTRHENKWTLIETLHCGTYDTADKCHLKHRFDGRIAGDVWSDGPTQLWGDGIKANPYFIRRISLPSPPAVDPYEEPGETYGLVFDFGSRKVVLSYLQTIGPDTDATLTNDFKLELPGNQSIVLVDGQAQGAVMGRYMLYWDMDSTPGLHLVDLASGKTILKNIYPAGWIY